MQDISYHPQTHLYVRLLQDKHSIMGSGTLMKQHFGYLHFQ